MREPTGDMLAAKRPRRFRRARPLLNVAAMLAIIAGVVVYGLLAPGLGLVVTMTTIFMYVALTQAWNVLGGYGGYLNLGVASFFGIGAYTTAILFHEYGWSPFYTAPLAGLVVAVFGLIVGLPSLRLRGAYFAIVTLIITFAVQLTVFDLDITQGSLGIVITPLSLSARHNDQLFYFLFLGLALLLTAIVYAIGRSNFGYALVAIREDEDAAEVLGVRTGQVKILAFVFCAFVAGVVGGLYSQRISFIEPTTIFSLDLSLNVVLIALVGGVGTWQGAVIAAPLMLLIADRLQLEIGQVWDQIFFGLILVVVAMFAPRGIMGLLRRARGRRLTV